MHVTCSKITQDLIFKPYQCSVSIILVFAFVFVGKVVQQKKKNKTKQKQKSYQILQWCSIDNEVHIIMKIQNPGTDKQ
jgi:REP element-mobilizing transposase RayT